MKKRSISFILVLIMLFSITAPDLIGYAQDSLPVAAEEAAEAEKYSPEPEKTDIPEEKFQTETKTEADEIIEEESDGKEAPGTEAPETKVPETEAPGTEAPGTEAPGTEAPETDTLETEAPGTKAPETKAPETEMPGTEVPETEAPETDTDETSAAITEEEIEFDENQPFTMAMLDASDDVEAYEIDMEKTGIPLKNFKLEAEDADGNPGSCKLEFPEGVKEIRVGEIQNTAPALLGDAEHGDEHAYSYAHVGNTKVFYIGHLTVHDGEKTEEYTVYTTDKHIDKRTVYVVLKEGEQISLVYQHGAYYSVSYQFQNMDGSIIQEGREDSAWTYDKIFGHDRVRSVARDDHFNGTVAIPRGYRAKVTVTDQDGKEYHSSELGKMKQYTYNPTYANQIPLAPGSEDALRFRDSFVIENVEKDITVTVQYEKIESFTFYAYYWTQTDYAGGPRNRPERISVSTGNAEESPKPENCILTFGAEQEEGKDPNSVTWKFNGITSGSGGARYTYEMNQLEINGEPIEIPMVSVGTTDEQATARTTLSTGTVIELTVISLGGTNGNNAKRAYTLKAENCYEDLTISGGNMLSHIHKEFATRALIGVKDSEYWHGTDDNGAWWTLKQNTLIAKTNKTPRDGYNTFRMKLADGYQNLNVTFTDKESRALQTNGDRFAETANNEFIQYLVRKPDGGLPETSKGSYQIVSYENWMPSEDGYYYCKATPELYDYMQLTDRNGAVLLWFYADSKRYGIDYRDGAGGDSAPNVDDIENLPPYQNGGADGYNLINNTKALVSNRVPLDTTGKFIFDHWEILKADGNGPTNEVKMGKDSKPYKLEAGGGLPLSKEALVELQDCLYYNVEQERNTLTLRAVWRNTEGKAPIPYTVNYYITEIKSGNQTGEPTLLEGHQHMANEGATLVTDLWKDGSKTLSPIITEILKGDNDQKKDYTKGGTVNYVIYEPLTDKKLVDVSTTNNVVNIFLVKQPELTVNKTVDGAYGDLTKPFRFTIELSRDGVPLSGAYSYKGGIVSGVSGAAAPADGTLTVTAGKAEIELAHGQQITFVNLPFGCYYTVKETAEDGYETAYNGSRGEGQAEGVLESDQTVRVENTREYIPDTGIPDDNHRFKMMLFLGTAALLLLAGAGIRRSRRKYSL